MTHEQNIIAGMAAKQVELAKDFVLVGEISAARYSYQRAIEKLEMAKTIGAEDHARLDESITELRTFLTKLSPMSGQKGSTALLKNAAKPNQE